MNAFRHGSRLKGLDEMPRPRRTLRQHLFAFRSRAQESKLLGWMWTFLKFAVLLSVLWGIARLTGLPIEQWVRDWLSLLG